MVRKIDTRDSIKTITSNSFITAEGLSDLSLKARKLLYLAISQCKKDDSEFYEYSLSVTDFAKMMEINPSHIYQSADSITDELMKGYIAVKERGKKKFTKYSLFSTCEYTEGGIIRFELNDKLTVFLLGLKRDFTQALLRDFMKMNSPYSMAVWHLIEKQINGKKPRITEVIEFDLSLDDLRTVTGTQDKFKQIVHFKTKVFEKALREIRENCGVCISYTNIKTGRAVTGFHCTAISEMHIDYDSIPAEKRREVERKTQELRAKEAQRAHENA